MRVESAAALGSLATGLVASACCLGPLVLAFFGISGAALAQRFEPFRPYALALTYGLLGGAFYFTYRPNACEPGSPCAMPRANRLGKALLWLAALFVILTTAFPWYALFLF